MRIGLTAGVVAGLLAVGVMAAEAPPRPADTDTRPCENHPDMDLAAYVAAYSTAPKEDLFHEPLSHFVPKDVIIIENSPAKFTTILSPGRYNPGSVPSYDLPIRDDDGAPLTDDSDRWQGDERWVNGETGTSPCRVRDSTGKRWVVLRIGRLLQYYNFDRFKPAGK